MEKLVYLLWNGSGRADRELAARVLGPVADALLSLDPAGLAVNLADDDAAGVALPLPPPPDDPARSPRCRSGWGATTTGARSRRCSRPWPTAWLATW